MSAGQTVPVSCHCGTLQGTLDARPRQGIHVVCLCSDCRRFARWLDGPATVLDAQGGTELFQTWPARLRITRGEDRIASVRLTSRGPLRHYTDCCRTPIGNTMTISHAPFVGIPVACLRFSSDEEKARALGPIALTVFGCDAEGEKPADAHERFPLSFIPHIIGFMGRGLIAGAQKPSPFFRDGKPVTEPTRLYQ